MLLHSARWLACLVAAGLLASSASLHAGDKKKPAEPILVKNEVLKEDDPEDTKRKGSPCKTYTVKLEEGKKYQFDLKSKDFDCFLRLEDSKGKEVAFNDDAEPGTFDSRIVYKANATGDYKVIVTRFDNKAGKFALTVNEAQKQPLQTGSKFQGKPMELKLKDGKAIYEGELTPKDATAQGRYFKLFTVQLEQGKVYRIDHRAGDQKEIDAYLFLEDADGTQLEANDDAPGTLDSRIVYKAGKTATYRIVATSLGQNQTGKFTLEVGPATDKKEIKDAETKYQIDNFSTLPEDQRAKFVAELKKRFEDQGENLTVNDARAAFTFAMEVESVDPKLARQVYTDYIKIFAAATSPQLKGFTKALENNMKGIDRLGKEIEITGKTVDGKDFDLKKLKGKVVLVDFWATWCGPCIAEMPNMLRAYEKYHKRGFEIIGVSLDRGDAEITQFNETRDIPWASINVEDSRKLADRYGVQAIPYPVLVDQAGRVVSVRARGPQLERLLERLLAEKK